MRARNRVASRIARPIATFPVVIALSNSARRADRRNVADAFPSGDAALEQVSRNSVTRPPRRGTYRSARPIVNRPRRAEIRQRQEQLATRQKVHDPIAATA